MISLYDLLEASNGQLFGEPAAQLFAGFSLDANRIDDATLFVAVRSDFGDTHQHMQDAVANGAIGLLCAQPPMFDTDGVTVIVVRDTEKAMTEWARFVMQRMPARAIAVTGTDARTTTVQAIASALSGDYRVHTHIDEYQMGRLSLPLSLAKLESDHDFSVIELRTTAPGEIAQLVKTVRPETVIVTSVGQAYLDRFKDVNQIAEEYIQALKSLPSTGLGILNYNDDAVRAMQGATMSRVITVGMGMDSFSADLMAYNVVVGSSRTGFDVRLSNNQRYVGNWVPLVGKFQLYSSLFALAVASQYGVSTEKALRQLTQVEALPGRMNTLVGDNGCLVVDDTFDATPESVAAGLDWLGKIRYDNTRTIFVLGDIDHLGERSRVAHRQIGQQAAEIADVIVTEGAQAALAGRAAQDVVSSGQQVHITYSIKDATSVLRSVSGIGEQDVFLVTGGASAQMENVVRSLLPETTDQSKVTSQRSVGVLPAQVGRPLQPSWVEVDLERLAQNVRNLKDYIGPKVRLMATVKADAYGHGSVAVSRVALQNGAEYLAVASVREALELRDAGIEAPILVLSYTPIYAVREAIRHNLTVTVYDLDLARAYNKIAKEVGGRLRIHVKVDTGMGRLGILPGEAVDLFRNLITMQNLEIEGIYTHFSVADEDPAFTQEQIKTFKGVLVPLRAAGIRFKYVHAANSAGTLLSKDFHLDMVRTGILMYGYWNQGAAQVAQMPDLLPVLTWKTVIAQVKTLPPGHHVGYGNTYITRDAERVAIIPIGYADGLRRSPVNQGTVLVHGQRAPILGRISMEKTVISVNRIDGASVGDEVVVLGEQGGKKITAQDIADRLQTIPYEVLTSVLPRIPRR